MTEQIALQLYTLREQAAVDFVGMLQEVAAAGYQAVEFAGHGGMPAVELRSLIDDLGLRAISSHVGYAQFAASPATVIAELNILGCSYAVLPGLPQEFRARSSLPYLVETLDRWGAVCQEGGLRFGYHNHGWELEPHAGGTTLDLIAARTDPALVDLQIDVYWALVAGADPIDLLQRHAGRVPTLHVKERAAGDEARDTTIGDGVTPWPEILAAAAAAGTEWLIVEQEDDPVNAYRDIRRSLGNLRRLTSAVS